MNICDKNVLVTGGAGFIGSHLVDALIREGCRVRVLDNLSNGKMDNLLNHDHSENLEFLYGDITDPFDMAKAVEGMDIVFHLATLGVRHSINHPFLNHRVNAEGTLLCLQESYRAGVKKFIYCSSSEVYGTAQFVPMPETHPTTPCTIYGASKLAGEAYTRAYYRTYGFSTVIIRPFNSYGPRSHFEGDAGEIIPKSILRGIAGKSILVFGDGLQTRDFTYVEDTAKGLVAAFTNEELVGGTFNMGSDFEISIRSLAEKIREKIGSDSSIIEFTKERPGDVLRLFSDSTRFHDITGWSPKTSFETGLSKTIEWFKARPEGIQSLIKFEKGINWEQGK